MREALDSRDGGGVIPASRGRCWLQEPLQEGIQTQTAEVLSLSGHLCSTEVDQDVLRDLAGPRPPQAGSGRLLQTGMAASCWTAAAATVKPFPPPRP